MTHTKDSRAIARFLLYSAFGLFMFFLPVTYKGNTTIPVDHIITLISKNFTSPVKLYILLVMYIGAVLPFVRKTWNKDGMSVFFTVAKVCGAVVGSLIYFDMMPGWLARPDFGPFLFNRLAVPVGLVIPIGSIFLAFLASFGLMEFAGVLMTPIMRPVFRTPGRSAIDAVASFVGSYSIGLLITNGVYRQGRYSAREAAVIATGFSTVSATFLLIVAKTLGLMDHWGVYFWGSMVVTFVVTAITAHIWPLSSIPETYFTGKPCSEPEQKGSLFAHAWHSGIETARATEPLVKLIGHNFMAGLNMAFIVIPSITSVGLLGLALAEFTPVFDVAGYIFQPFFKLFGVAQAGLAGKAAALSLAEMFLPALILKTAVPPATPLLKFVIAIVSISEILFFSASIPCVMGTDIPLKLRDILVIWFERVVLSILLAIPLGMLLGFSDIVQ